MALDPTRYTKEAFSLFGQASTHNPQKKAANAAVKELNQGIEGVFDRSVCPYPDNLYKRLWQNLEEKVGKKENDGETKVQESFIMRIITDLFTGSRELLKEGLCRN